MYQWYTNYRIDYNNKDPKIVIATNCFSGLSNEVLHDAKIFSIYIPVTDDKSIVIKDHHSARLTNKIEAINQINLLKKAGFPIKYKKDKIENYDAFRVYFDITNKHKHEVLLIATYIRYIYELKMYKDDIEELKEKENYYSIFNIYSELLKNIPNFDPSLLFHIAEQLTDQTLINNNHSGSPIGIKIYIYKPVTIKDRLEKIKTVNNVQSTFTINGVISSFKLKLLDNFKNKNYSEIRKLFNI